MRSILVFCFMAFAAGPLAAQVPVQAPQAATTIDVTGTRIDGDPIPRQGYRFSQAHIALRRSDPAVATSALVLRLEVEITVDCQDNQGRPAQCPKTSVYSLPDEDFQIVRPETVSRNNRGFVKYIGGGRDVRVGIITGLGNTEWVVLGRDHSITANHQSVRLVLLDRSGARPAPVATPAVVDSDDVRQR